MARRVPDKLLTGFVLIDRQHEEIYEKFDDLSDQLERSGDAEILRRTLDYLVQYVNIHFDFEETAMKAYGYPHRVEHMTAHLVLRENARALRDEAASEGPSPDLVERARQLLAEALFAHIGEHDLKMAGYLKQKNPGDWTL